MTDGFIRVAALAPDGAVASPRENAQELIRLAKTAHDSFGARVLAYPAMAFSAGTVGDLVTQPRLLTACEEALSLYCAETAACDMISFVGLPVRVGGKVYDCAACVCRGRLLGLVPAHTLRGGAGALTPYTGENITIHYGGAEVPFGNKQLFTCETMPSLVIAVEFDGDLHADLPLSTAACHAGATLVVCLSAEPEVIGAAERRRTLVKAHTARTLSAYLLAGAGAAESTTDGVCGGHEMIASLGRLVDDCAPFTNAQACGDVDLENVLFARSREDNFRVERPADWRETPFSLTVRETALITPVKTLPFVPSDEEREARCETVLNIQARALATRMMRAHAKTAVLGVSGGLDSTLALLVCVRAVQRLAHCDLSASDILALTMPCFGTTARTRSNAQRLAEALGTTFMEADISESVTAHLAVLGHDPDDHSVVYENAQARERTQTLMNLSNQRGGLVVGTGDLSELALGWATYNGDHMSMYGVNAGIPKTLMRCLVSYEAHRLEREGNLEAAEVLRDILATPVSPELLPPKDGEIAQCTEDIVGPYELHDFFLYYIIRRGYTPKKLLRYAVHAFRGSYDEDTIRRWLIIFVRRFFSQQFKRSCLPDGPAVGTVSLSPRGAWSMPSDASAAAWLEELT